MSSSVPPPRFESPDAVLYEFSEDNLDVDATPRPAGDEVLRRCISERFATEASAREVPVRLDHLLALAREQEQFCRGAQDGFGLARCLGNQALLQKARGRLEEARLLLEQLEPFCRRLDDVEGLAFAQLHRAALLAEQTSQPAAALSLAEEALRVAGQHHLSSLEQQSERLVRNLRARLSAG